jgi:hypothetical protein
MSFSIKATPGMRIINTLISSGPMKLHQAPAPSAMAPIAHRMKKLHFTAAYRRMASGSQSLQQLINA